ncbi:membrane protein [Porphyromonas macacae]|uniref:Membrane protein n=1 Tax=Porphyromonas macacae TaxID=28115 RepID=A0A0A2EB35_9PORP|nr:OmpA family protein [Porphyromonas macacae]KGN74837.1 membrane protein [Porphyromonas macacae]
MRIQHKLCAIALASFIGIFSGAAQNKEQIADEPRTSKAWEIGIGGSLINLDRISITGFQSLPDKYLYNLKVHHLMGGVNLYAARELNPWFYLDLQGTMGIAKNNEQNASSKHNFLYMGGLGLQFRLSPLFRSRYVEPYLRIGVNYLHKDFKTTYSGVFKNDPTGQAHWESNDTWNPGGRSKDKDNFIPLSFGAGVNAWLNNSLGLGLQGEYLMPVEKGLPRFAQISLRVMWRIGGKDKRPAPVYHEVEIPVEKLVERVVEKEVKIPVEKSIYDLFNNINFEFDKYTFTPETEEILDQIATILTHFKNEHFLITGFTDAKGTNTYNLQLSRKRAEAVVNALVKRGTPQEMLKWRGVGKKAVSMPASEADNIRRGDRKVTIEKVDIMEYWNKLP